LLQLLQPLCCELSANFLSVAANVEYMLDGLEATLRAKEFLAKIFERACFEVEEASCDKGVWKITWKVYSCPIEARYEVKVNAENGEIVEVCETSSGGWGRGRGKWCWRREDTNTEL